MIDIILNKTDLLVSPLEDYYSKNKSFATKDDKPCDVGIIEAVGSELPLETIGKVIYYHKNMATGVNLKGVGIFDLVPDHSKLLIRMDQDKNNY